MNIDEMDNAIKTAIHDRYDGYTIEWYASGFNYATGIREVLYDIYLKDGSRFIAVGRCDDLGQVSITEREYVAH
ncbi:hypothetical protein PAECIP111893_02395 [Paenibacillus plantiphilus]|uniref:Phage protein n=1 Tax=Paenibacillus plantiphilus TaxID=2905650 RepID=A0ABM9C8M5_9BACL|nr:hypothetical protein [Paenibacillus plantiphilus]CAH1205695.1 hypothetical protein PAECIP111893_02395 [Paenibacillus plantiphilus]